MTPDLASALSVFSMASDYVRAAGLDAEVEWQRRTNLDRFTETELLRESAWVILCTGFREAIVRRIFGHISLCFCDWESSSAIVAADPACKIAARSSFRNEAKLNAIFGVAAFVHELGFQVFKTSVVSEPIRQLRRLPFIGPVTVWHLAKNLGLNVAKPDRHLVRLSNGLGFRDTEEFCSAIAEVSGEDVKVIDLIIWRYLVDTARSGLRRHANQRAFGERKNIISKISTYNGQVGERMSRSRPGSA